MKQNDKPECKQCKDCSCGSFCPHDCERNIGKSTDRVRIIWMTIIKNCSIYRGKGSNYKQRRPKSAEYEEFSYIKNLKGTGLDRSSEKRG